jgi:hypothetical protein
MSKDTTSLGYFMEDPRTPMRLEVALRKTNGTGN